MAINSIFPLSNYALLIELGASPTSPTGVNVGEGWVAVLVRACLEGMAEIDEESPYGVNGGLARWLIDDVRCRMSLPFPESNDCPYSPQLDPVPLRTTLLLRCTSRV